MPLTITLKGKKRAIGDVRAPTYPTSSSAVSPDSEPPHPTKRLKRAETKPCPVCDEQIPLRLLAMHARLESERVEAIINKVGSLEVVYDEDNDPGPSSRIRRSALKARKSMTTRTDLDSVERSEKTIQAVKKRRKQRYNKLKDMAKDEEEGFHSRGSRPRIFTGTEIICPVCSAAVRGDEDVVDAHVDACLANENIRLEEARERELQHRRQLDEELWEDFEESPGGYVGNVRGAGFHSRDQRQEDVDEEVDIDGDDQAVYGEVQFTEGDVVPGNNSQEEIDEDLELEIEGDGGGSQGRTLRELVAAGKSVQRKDARSSASDTGAVDLTILTARQHGNKDSLIQALDTKIKQLEVAQGAAPASALCRICLDPYNEPTVSTGCWHTCCRECWLRCLGSTKLCPICKRITGATDLRRIYL